MKTLTTLLFAATFSFSSCGGGKEKVTITAAENTAKQELFGDVNRVEFWRVVDGMNSSPIIIEEYSEIQNFYAGIGGEIDKKPDCKFNAGITFVKENGEMIFTELNLNAGCETISYFNANGKMEHHSILASGVKLFNETMDKIELPN